MISWDENMFKFVTRGWSGGMVAELCVQSDIKVLRWVLKRFNEE